MSLFYRRRRGSREMGRGIDRGFDGWGGFTRVRGMESFSFFWEDFLLERITCAARALGKAAFMTCWIRARQEMRPAS